MDSTPALQLSISTYSKFDFVCIQLQQVHTHTYKQEITFLNA